MIIFQEENYDSLFNDDNFPILIKENFQETGVLNTSFKLTPNYAMYKLLDEQNFLGLYSARENGVLVGFFIAAITPHQHYKDILVAEADTFFLSKNSRQGLTGYRFLKYVISKLKLRVKLIFLTTTIKRNLSGIFTHLGFKLVDYKYLLEI